MLDSNIIPISVNPRVSLRASNISVDGNATARNSFTETTIKRIVRRHFPFWTTNSVPITNAEQNALRYILRRSRKEILERIPREDNIVKLSTVTHGMITSETSDKPHIKPDRSKWLLVFRSEPQRGHLQSASTDPSDSVVFETRHEGRESFCVTLQTTDHKIHFPLTPERIKPLKRIRRELIKQNERSFTFGGFSYIHRNPYQQELQRLSDEILVLINGIKCRAGMEKKKTKKHQARSSPVFAGKLVEGSRFGIG